MSSFYWYDLETFGTSPRFDRIAQFAGIRTDINLNPVSEPDMFYCKTSADTFIDPEACLVTGITPDICNKQGMVEREFFEKINDIFSEAHTCVAGFNSIRFDDEFIRYGNYRNLIDPYMREWANGNSRWDVIDLMRACYALRPEGIQWPMHEEGKPSFRLTDLTEANNMVHTSAHDALSDVEATIQVARLIRDKQPELFNYGLRLRDKNYVKSLLNWQFLKPIVHVSSKIPAQRGCLAVMLPLAVHPNNPNGIICYDLSANPDDLFELDIEDIRDRIFTPQEELPEDCSRIPLKTIHVNKCPFVAPLSTLKNVDLQRISLNYSLNKTHLQKFQSFGDIAAKVAEVFNQPFDSESEDVDAMLYSGFFTAQDKSLFNQIRGMDLMKVKPSQYAFKDPRASELVFRYVARNYPEGLTTLETKNWHETIRKNLYWRFGEKASHLFEKINQLRLVNADSVENLEILDSIEGYTRFRLEYIS